MSHPERHIPFSNIPLLMHQKWDTTQLTGINEMVISYIETWLKDAVSPPPGSSEMAYFIWDNEGVLTLMEEYEHDLVRDFVEVFSPVEKVDIFRIAVCKWFGGIVSLRSFSFIHLPTNQLISTAMSTRKRFNTHLSGFTQLISRNGLME